jgi:quinol monooxygenase YgiN/quercetin dioxygenase-like cupin family protein
MKTKSVFAIVLLALVVTSRAIAQDPVPMYPDNYKVLIENDRVRVLDFKLRKGATEKFHSHPAMVTYVLEPFKIRFSFPDGKTAIREAKAGDVLFGEAVVHSPVNIGDTDAHGILVELKSSPKTTEATNSELQTELVTALTFLRGTSGSAEDLKRELLSTTAPTQAEPGNLRYDLYQSLANPDNFLRIELWRNLAALEEHKQTPHLKASFERRKAKGWTSEITTWKRVPDDVTLTAKQ